MGRRLYKGGVMTFEKLIEELFVNHWLFTTCFAPEVTLIYAWITDQMAWFWGSLALAVIAAGLRKS